MELWSLKKEVFSNFSYRFLNPRDLNYNCSNLLDLRNLQEQFKKTFCSKNWSSDQEFFLKLEAEAREFSKILKSLEQFIQTVKGQNNVW